MPLRKSMCQFHESVSMFLLQRSSALACFSWVVVQLLASSMDTIIAILLFLIGLAVVSCGIMLSVWCVKIGGEPWRRRRGRVSSRPEPPRRSGMSACAAPAGAATNGGVPPAPELLKLAASD